MLIKDLIKQLQDLYDSYDEEYKKVMGEPDIMIDVFNLVSEGLHTFHYSGFSPDIKIEKSSDGVYDILSAFSVSYD